MDSESLIVDGCIGGEVLLTNKRSGFKTYRKRGKVIKKRLIVTKKQGKVTKKWGKVIKKQGIF